MTLDPTTTATLPGLGFLGTLAESAWQTLWLLLRNRLLWVMLAAELVAGVLAYGVAGFDRNRLDGRDLYCLLAWWLQAWLVLPWATMYLAIQAVHVEIEDRTFHYLFLRPVGRAPLLLGKWLAASVVSAALVAVGATVLHFAVAAQPAIWGDGIDRHAWHTFVLLLCLGAAAYAAFGVWFGATFRRPLVWAAILAVFQMITALLPVSAGVRAITVSDPLRRLLLHRIEPDAQLEQMLWPGDRAMRHEVIGEPVVALIVLSVVLLALGLFSYCRAEYDSRHRE